VKRIDVILPVYNEESAIEIFHRTLCQVLSQLEERYAFHLIYVVDRCRDRSFEILKGIARRQGNMTVLHMSRRFGHQMSLVAGIDRSSGDAAIMMDTDLQHPPSLVPVLLENFEKGYEIVHTVRQYDPRTPFAKRFTSDLFYRLQNWLSPVELRSGVADFRLIGRRVVEVFQKSIREHNQFLRALFQWIGYSSIYVEYQCDPRVAGETKYTLPHLLRFLGDGIVSFSRLPLRLAVMVGLAMTGLSVLYGVFLLYCFFFGVHSIFPPGYASLMLVFVFISGIQLILMGTIGEYIGHIFDEVKGRPLYVIDEAVEGQIRESTMSGM
jgi:glycosyltransferase involved in cell wall biosynthesis